MSAQLLRDGAAAARRVAAMHKGGQQQPIHQAVADWLETCTRIWEGDAQTGVKIASTHGAEDIARAYLGREQP